MPDKQTLQLEHAGIFRRIAALFYDSFLIGAIWFGITGIGVLLNGNEAMPNWVDHYILFPLLILSAFFFYFWFWTHGGQTLGMRAWNIKILSCENTTPTLLQCIKRFLFAILFLGSGFLICFFTQDKKSLHDLLSDTQVLLIPKEVH